MTAYFGIREAGPLMPRDRVLVAGASGSVGSMAAQLAKISGAHVVGVAGGADRCRWVVETLGIDDCNDYKAPDFTARLEAAFPDGVDVFSDGIGGAFTETVTSRMNQNGRLFAYGGAAAAYAGQPFVQRSRREMYGLSEKVDALLKARNIKSPVWLVSTFYTERLKAEDDLSRHLISEALKPINNVVEGLEKLPEAIIGLYQSAHAGKLQVRIEAAAGEP
jgi:NADPH-dependent curcumin reductase CurA